MLSVYHLLSYYFTLLMFGTCGLLLSLFALLAGCLPKTERIERAFQRLIQKNFEWFHQWCEFARLVYVRYHGFERLPAGGMVLAANHPALIDITCLMARVPNAVCIFKPAVRRNPVLGAARRAGYVASDGGHEVVTRVAAQISAGHTLVIFPEGTRTPPGEKLLPFKPGFALIARRARAPIQLVRIETNSDVLTKGRPWWWLPKFPAHIHITAGPLITVDEATSTTAISAEIESWFRSGDAAQPARATADLGFLEGSPSSS